MAVRVKPDMRTRVPVGYPGTIVGIPRYQVPGICEEKLQTMKCTAAVDVTLLLLFYHCGIEGAQTFAVTRVKHSGLEYDSAHQRSPPSRPGHRKQTLAGHARELLSESVSVVKVSPDAVVDIEATVRLTDEEACYVVEDLELYLASVLRYFFRNEMGWALLGLELKLVKLHSSVLCRRSHGKSKAQSSARSDAIRSSSDPSFSFRRKDVEFGEATARLDMKLAFEDTVSDIDVEELLYYPRFVSASAKTEAGGGSGSSNEVYLPLGVIVLAAFAVGMVIVVFVVYAYIFCGRRRGAQPRQKGISAPPQSPSFESRAKSLKMELMSELAAPDSDTVPEFESADKALATSFSRTNHQDRPKSSPAGVTLHSSSPPIIKPTLSCPPAAGSAANIQMSGPESEGDFGTLSRKDETAAATEETLTPRRERHALHTMQLRKHELPSGGMLPTRMGGPGVNVSCTFVQETNSAPVQINGPASAAAWSGKLLVQGRNSIIQIEEVIEG